MRGSLVAVAAESLDQITARCDGQAAGTYGPGLGLPPAHSGELTYYYWEPTSIKGATIAIGFDPTFIARLFHSCSVVGTITNRYGLHNQEYGVPIQLCGAPRLPLARLWPLLKSFQ